MFKRLCKYSFILFLSCFLLSCDKDQNAVFDAALDRLEPELQATENVNDKIEILERFRKSYDGHPRIGTIRTRIEALKARQEKKEVEQQNLGVDRKELQKKIEEGDFAAMSSFALSAIAGRAKSDRDNAGIEKVGLPGFSTVHEFENPAMYISPTRVRSYIGHAMYLTEKTWLSRCDWKCENLYVSKLLKKVLGEDLFKADGTMNPVGVKKLVGLLDGESFGKVTYSELNKVFGPSIRRILNVRQAIRTIGDEKIMSAFNTQRTTDFNGLPSWYHDMSKKTPEIKALSLRKFPITRTFGFWIRRMDDKTADTIETFLKKVIKKGE